MDNYLKYVVKIYFTIIRERYVLPNAFTTEPKGRTVE